MTTGVTLTLNADMRVGGVQESITVTGETPVVDVQNSTRVQRVLSDEVLAALPASRGYGNLLATVSGIQSNANQNGGVNPGMIFFTSRGGRSNEGTVQIDGMNVGSAFNGGGVAGYGYDTTNAQEVQLTVAGGLGEADRGGPQFNIVPKTGGNTFSGTYFGSLSGEWSQGNNVDDLLKSYGIPAPGKIIKNWDTSFSLGGPIKRDKVWFFAVTRTLGEYTDIAGRFGNLNAGNPSAWNYVVDPSIKSRTSGSRKVVGARVTAQLSERNKISGYFDYQFQLQRQLVRQGRRAVPRARRRLGRGLRVRHLVAGVDQSQKGAEHIMQLSYTAPLTNKLLLEAAASQFLSNWNPTSPAGALNYDPFIPVQERSLAGGVPVPNMVYHGYAGLNNNHQTHNVWRASLAYVTGAHSMKVGYAGAYEVTDIFGDFATHGLQYRFNAGVPDLITQRITKWQQANRTRYDAFYVQDQWTRSRLTLQGALRYEHAWSFFPEGLNGLLTDSVFGGPARTLPRADGVTGYKDIAPRMGMAYDVFGNGRTGIKVNLSKYWQYAANDGVYIGTNPASTFAQTANRSWTDANGNFTSQLRPAEPPGAGQSRRAAATSAAPWTTRTSSPSGRPGPLWGRRPRSTRRLLSGWNVRPYDWQFSASVQQQLLPRVSAEIGFSRRWWGNFTATDNRAVGPQDFDTYTFTAPSDPRLSSSGQPVSYVLRNNRTAFGAVDNYLTLASNYGDVSAYWQGLELNVNARMTNSLTRAGRLHRGCGHPRFL